VCTLKIIGTLFYIMTFKLAINLNCRDFFKIVRTLNNVQVSRNTAILSEEKKKNPNIHYTYISQTTSSQSSCYKQVRGEQLLF